MICVARAADVHAHPILNETPELERLGDEIAELAAHLHAATYRLLVMLREFDERGGWWCGGFRSCAHWLSWRTGIGLGAAREKMRVARALAQLPQLSEAMRRGELSFAKVRATTRVATPANEEICWSWRGRVRRLTSRRSCGPGGGWTGWRSSSTSVSGTGNVS